jgi:hypothetical protein
MTVFYKFRILIVFLLSFSLYSQNVEEIDTTSIISYADKIIIKTNLSTETDTYILKTGNTLDLKILPNNSYKLFLSFDYQFIGLSFGFAPNFFNDKQDDVLKGESSFSDLKFRFFLGNWVQGIQYKKIKGYYVENTQDFEDNWIEGMNPYLQIPSLANVTWGMSTSYIFNPKFSIRNILYQTEWQKKSAGSFVPTLYYDYNKSSFDFSDSKSEENTFNTRLAFGYHYTFVIKENWFIAPNISPSLGIKFSKTKSNVDNIEYTEKDTYLTKFLEGGLQIGYSTKKVIFGANFNFNSSWYKKDKVSLVENDQVFGVVYFGYRFDTPKFIEDSYNWLNKKIK